MSKQTQTTRKTVKDIAAAKGATPLVMLTAYDAPTAAILDPHCDILLVGDSLGMVVHGLPSTVGVTMEMMILHGQAVMRGASQAMVVVDMPFGSYETNADQAFLNAVRIMKETGCQAIKIESGAYAAGQIAHLVERGIPVMGHIGLRPQAINVDGGFRAKGRTEDERDRVIAEARAAADAGAFCIVIEGVAEDLAAAITAEVSCPTIGIGASAACDGQVLVTQDMLGLFDWTPKFVRRYADLREVVDKAAAEYAADVRARRFPGTAETYSLRKQGS
ncbi:3-methyl-2-oxobutanoate hydroxymethyltransferase [Hyphomonas neptunium ATCC 15444]|uniref:3-methyl-2-oxobutanoate hydroxymethyltransferase n=2 Tax=Hyphomonas TaxID=85 RepID=PANB_HYPNA|nr:MULTISPECIES: 3-methyl-2-oxobutanoate hydroxymethyltransferase [Hyphomonas]Q0C444.1 RecName: Full=3-methyl-2-oxobutanoate hydroxymethyltransferase; AltName: Full=Ketopantoate hydroxymethyltransferase; Short=KPHMT [Hyphomonas neptunium ATCC 15444]ABI76074.1 3-methyl-2-oxobutanoate hydroxymethyltransferase [Hyphomonas neptunium ATCC 15444]KCZ96289.1 3-methyl-2-oxobutanoate hydroxymethyltransferase [Hyphomonas hirschiana VP5]